LKSVVTFVLPYRWLCYGDARSGSGSRGGESQASEDDMRVAELMEQINLTKDEEQFTAFSDEEEDGGNGRAVEFSLIGKVLSRRRSTSPRSRWPCGQRGVILLTSD
jgi:hypothetical protein